jgi:hypothetical protein
MIMFFSTTVLQLCWTTVLLQSRAHGQPIHSDMATARTNQPTRAMGMPMDFEDVSIKLFGNVKHSLKFQTLKLTRGIDSGPRWERILMGSLKVDIMVERIYSALASVFDSASCYAHPKRHRNSQNIGCSNLQCRCFPLVSDLDRWRYDCQSITTL